MSNEQYIERAASMSGEAKSAAVNQLTKQFKQFKNHVSLSQNEIIKAVNSAREMGDTIWEITGHQKLLAGEFSQLEMALSDAGLSFARECLSIRRQLDEPVTDYAKAKPVWDRIVVQLELIEKPRRGQETLHTKIPMEIFLADVVRMKNELARLVKTEPVSKWPSFYRQTFLAQARPIHETYIEALNVAE